MKKVFSAILAGFLLVAITASCGSGRAHCDAYGDATLKAGVEDLAQE